MYSETEFVDTICNYRHLLRLSKVNAGLVLILMYFAIVSHLPFIRQVIFLTSVTIQ